MTKNFLLEEKVPEEQDLLDDDGYPTDYALYRIKNWDIIKDGIVTLFDLVLSLWSYPDAIKTYENDENKTHSLATGGWSGNESLIYTLQENALFWTLCWHLSSRGGYYEFKVKEII